MSKRERKNLTKKKERNVWKGKNDVKKEIENKRMKETKNT